MRKRIINEVLGMYGDSRDAVNEVSIMFAHQIELAQEDLKRSEQIYGDDYIAIVETVDLKKQELARYANTALNGFIRCAENGSTEKRRTELLIQYMEFLKGLCESDLLKNRISAYRASPLTNAINEYKRAAASEFVELSGSALAILRGEK